MRHPRRQPDAADRPLAPGLLLQHRRGAARSHVRAGRRRGLRVDIEPYYRDEFVLGYEWQFSDNWALDAKGIYWRVDNLVGFDAAARRPVPAVPRWSRTTTTTPTSCAASTSSTTSSAAGSAPRTRRIRSSTGSRRITAATRRCSSSSTGVSATAGPGTTTSPSPRSRARPTVAATAATTSAPSTRWTTTTAGTWRRS